MTHDYVRRLAEGMVREVCFLGMPACLDADVDDVIGDVAFLPTTSTRRVQVDFGIRGA